MSEIYPSVRLAIRDSVTRILFDRPGKWLTTADLLNYCEEAETSDTLAKILSDMAKTGRLVRGLKTLNAQGREVNTWGLSPKLRVARENPGGPTPGPVPTRQSRRTGLRLAD